MDELVIRDADVVDGSGADGYRAGVVVGGGRIVSVVQEAAAAGDHRPPARRPRGRRPRDHAAPGAHRRLDGSIRDAPGRG
ncbi:hypothetical protein NGM37_58130, partial [Streptomyces sp. TRM76130]|nr:hypothetical protein [Streptomyces sp. TRM76130]